MEVGDAAGGRSSANTAAGRPPRRRATPANGSTTAATPIRALGASPPTRPVGRTSRWSSPLAAPHAYDGAARRPPGHRANESLVAWEADVRVVHRRSRRMTSGRRYRVPVTTGAAGSQTPRTVEGAAIMARVTMAAVSALWNGSDRLGDPRQFQLASESLCGIGVVLGSVSRTSARHALHERRQKVGRHQ